MQDFIIEIMEKFGYLGVFLLILVENIFPPIPSEVILLFGGFMTTQSDGLNIWLVIIVSTLGSLIGGIILYMIGRLLSVQRLEKIVEGKIGRLLRLKKSDIEKSEKWFLKHGGKSILFCRFVPIVRSLISVPAGMAKYKITPFLLLTLVGTLIWNTVLIFLGRWLGAAWEKIAAYLDTYTLIVLLVIGAVVVVAMFLFVKHRFIDKKEDSDGEND